MPVFLMLGDMADYVTLEHRPILQVGTWNASTGTEAITDDDLTEIVRAANSGVLDNPVIKIGHIDPRFQTYLEDGSPAYGQMTNPTIEDGVLYVDYVNVPADLAEGLDSAYPHSSVELARNVVLRDQEGNIVHEFGCVLTANALLGATAPAVKGLSTKLSGVVAASAEAPRFTEIRMAQFSLPGGNTAKGLADKLAAAVQVEHSSDSVWAYLEDFTDDRVIFGVEGYGEATYYEQAYTVAGPNSSPELTGDPVQVVKETSWVKEKTDDTPTVQPRDPDLAQAMSEGTEETPTSPETQGETTMAVDKEKAAELRKQYGLPKNASTDDLLAAVIADKDKKNVAPGSDETPNDKVRKQQVDELNKLPNFAEGDEDDEDETDPAARTAEDDEDEDDEEDAEEENSEEEIPVDDQGGDAQETPGEARRDLSAGRKAKRKVSVKSAKVSPSLLSDVTQRLSAAEARLAAREEAETKARRDGFVRSWYRAGLIADDECQKVRAKLDRDENLTVELISDRVPMFATSEIGHAEPSMFADTTKAAIESDYAADDAVFSPSK